MSHVYIFVRNDLSTPQKIVQSSHAAIEAGRNGLIPQNIEHPSVVLLSAASEEAIKTVCQRLTVEGIRYCVFTEPDIGDQATALITEPIQEEKRRVFRRYQCVK